MGRGRNCRFLSEKVAHGMASLLADNSMRYDKEQYRKIISCRDELPERKREERRNCVECIMLMLRGF